MDRFNPQFGSRLPRMPSEVLIHIASFLLPSELGNVRLACKTLEHKLFNFFSHTFFHTKKCMVTTDSLQTLLAISKHPALSPCLRRVLISTERPFINTGYDLEEKHRMHLGVADHYSWMTTGALRDVLAEAFGNLSNLDAVSIGHFDCRVAGAPSGQSMNVFQNWQDKNPGYIDQLLSIVIAALATAQARPQSIEAAISWSSRRRCGLTDHAFSIAPPLEASVTPLLSGLRSLHFVLRGVRGGYYDMVRKFLSLTRNLTWLRLGITADISPASLPGFDIDKDIEEFLSWLALEETERPTNHFDTPPTALRHLERLDLGPLFCRSQTLLRLAAKYGPTLRWLSLGTVCLPKPDPFDRKVNPWSTFLLKLTEAPGLHLRMLELDHLQVVSSGSVAYVLFPNPNTGALVKTRTFSAHLTNLGEAVKEAVKEITVK
ncbi:hypothetical protein N656DRAFT_776899 [Canariomyces notabilis]|uniref:F-box domain-containing protein n=1 Tax=Canariomyces notabilis TaxID=2074819 RepID=A0AAN6THW1_9PEZI|nr:hypothetical protein N656DRAFT_776899 [Canariomyces arenarius]